ncbi:isoprenyl transferase [Kaustia mangrovi]|uniref:Isoprenyl transferase n=2 Tax=Kaustia mangrovi TaxID=2593653 RepID=A0A7S8HAI6_9HYPH|nr:isoprenyl transferase [Kaustia mangrovi]QPC41474.1 isoprenyl transferase [Kaustia mangrovi]
MSLGANQLASADVEALSAGGGTLPRHVAIIMDGNGRWARRRGLPRTAGHSQGVEAVRKTVAAALDLGIDYLTLYSFSSENWSRPKEEVGYLLNLLRRFADRDVALLHERGVRIRVIGERETLQRDIVALIESAEERTRDNTAMTLVIAFNYGARDEIARAVRELAAAVERGELAPDAITPAHVARHLYTADIPDPDLIVRTSGEQRLSNFLLWQSAYSEFVFVDAHWPEFDKAQFMNAIREFMSRERRFGGISQTTP